METRVVVDPPQSTRRCLLRGEDVLRSGSRTATKKEGFYCVYIIYRGRQEGKGSVAPNAKFSCGLVIILNNNPTCQLWIKGLKCLFLISASKLVDWWFHVRWRRKIPTGLWIMVIMAIFYTKDRYEM